jgi:hypothetical protein
MLVFVIRSCLYSYLTGTSSFSGSWFPQDSIKIGIFLSETDLNDNRVESVSTVPLQFLRDIVDFRSF